MHFAALLALAVTPPGNMSKTVAFGRTTVRMQQSIGQGAQVTCTIETVVGGESIYKHSSAFPLRGEFAGCFAVPSEQDNGDFLMVRESGEAPHTLLIASSGKVMDIDEVLVRGGRWNMVAAD